MEGIISYIEKVSIERLEIVCSNLGGVYQHLMDLKNRYVVDYDDFKKFSITMKKLLLAKKKSDVVYYGFGRNSKWGRIFSKTPSLQSCDKIVRNFISDDLYYDLDIVNCHPTILYNLLDELKYDNYMKPYIENRQDVFDTIMKCDDYINNDECKTMMLRLINGGNKNTVFCGDYLIEFRKKHFEFLEYFYGYCSTNKDFVKFYKKAYRDKKEENKIGMCLNSYFNYIENEILTDVRNYLTDNGIEISTLCFDGLQVYKSSVDDVDKLICNLNDFIKDKQHPMYKLKEKPMISTLDSSLFIKQENDEIDELLLKSMCNDQESSAMLVFDHIRLDIKYDGVDLYQYNAERCLWVKTDIGCVQLSIKTFLESKFNPVIEKYIVTDEASEKQLKIFKNVLARLGNTSYIKGICDPLIRMIKIKCDDAAFICEHFDKHAGLLPLINCRILDLKINTTRDRIREDYFTFEIDCDYIENYDEDMCVNYFKSLLYDFRNKKECSDDLYDNFVTSMGYILTGENCLRKFFNLYGEGCNGKSVLLRLMGQILGKFFGAGTKRVFTKSQNNASHEADLWHIKGCRMITISEMSDSEQYNEDMIKGISGSDPRYLRNCGGANPILTIVSGVIVIATNQQAKFDQTDIAFQNRLIVYDFKNVFEENDEYIKMIFSLKDHIFSYLADVVYRHFYKKNKTIVWCDEVIVSTNKVKNCKNTFKDFIEKYEKTFIKGTSITPRNCIYEMYKDFCEKEFIENKDVLKLQSFYKQFENNTGFFETCKRVNGKTCKGYLMDIHCENAFSDDDDDDFM